MNYYFNLRLFFASIFIGSLLFVSCSDQKSSEVSDDSIPIIENTDSLELEELEDDVAAINYILPSPLQVATLFNKSGLKYDEKLLNSLNNAPKYQNEFDKTINIGVYSSDLAYALLNNQTQYSLDCLKTIKKLSDEVGIGSVYSGENYMNRFNNNINKFDSLVEIFNNINLDTKSFLAENEKELTGLVIFAGAWIESMYISTQSVQKLMNDKITRRIAEQHVTLSALIKMYEAENDLGDQMKITLEDLRKIESVYNDCSDYRDKKAIDSESDVLDFDMTMEEKAKLSSTISEIRNSIVKFK